MDSKIIRLGMETEKDLLDSNSSHAEFDFSHRRLSMRRAGSITQIMDRDGL